MKKLEKCQHCGEQKEDCYHGFIAMCLPIPEAEAKIDKWNLIDAYKTLLNQHENKLSRPPSQEEFNNTIKTHPEFSKKWSTKNWWKNLERTDLTYEEAKELDDLCSYDQFLNTVGRGIQCNDCGKLEAELYEKYYPEQYKSE